jgi:circadian clock protein KaiC
VTRYVELLSQLHRMVSVLKVRDAEINSAMHRFVITSSGIVIDPDSKAAEEILAQATRQGGYRGQSGAPAAQFGSEG